MKKDKKMALQMMNAIGLKDITSKKQKREGRIMVEDPKSGDRYTLSPKTGWVRIYPATYISEGWQDTKPSMWNTYQINPTDSWGYKIPVYNFKDMALKVLSNVTSRRARRK
jgi:hypothetical protein